MAKIILICGAPGSGKSTLASALAARLGIRSLMGTDTIREILRACVSKETCPALHTSAILACEWAPEGESKMIWGFRQQAIDVKPGVDAVIRRALKENTDLVLEGIHLIPGIVSIRDAGITHMVIQVRDKEAHLEQLAGQGKDRSTYKIDLFEKARAFQSHLEDEAAKHGAMLVPNENIENMVNRILLVTR